MKKQTTAAFLMVVLGLCQLGLADLRAQGPQEGIKVHGHWVIDIRQPDGTLVSHHEFENALQPDARGFLVAVLARAITPGRWRIGLEGGCRYQGIPVKCSIMPEDDNENQAASSSVFTTLTVRRVSTFGIGLTGTATANATEDIRVVNTDLTYCNRAGLSIEGALSTVPPAICGQAGVPGAEMQGFSISAFTRTIVTIPVVAGQIIQVTVVISFS